jgi:hypothetical protein
MKNLNRLNKRAKAGKLFTGLMAIVCGSVFMPTAYANSPREPEPAIHGGGIVDRQEISGPSAVWSPTSSNTNIGALQNAFKTSIFVQTNPNLGAFLTSIPIDLPPNLAGYNLLSLRYSSQSINNVGIGVGWQWNLPFIITKSTFNERSQFSHMGPWGNFDLIPTKEDVGPISPLVGAIVGTKPESIVTFRPSLDEGGYLFVDVKTDSNEYWVGLNPSGEKWLFSKTGLPIKFFSRHRNSIEFYWANGVLTKIVDPNSKWVMSITYSEKLQTYPQISDGQWVFLPQSIDSIVMKSPNQADTKKLIFTNEGEYLQRVVIAGGVRPLFEASYQHFLPAILGRAANDFTRNDNKVYIDRNTAEPQVIASKDRTGSFDLDGEHKESLSYQYIDINGDHITDRIVYDGRELAGQVKDKISELSRTIYVGPRASENAQLEVTDKILSKIIERFNNEDINVYVELGVAHAPGESATFRRDNSIDIENQLHKRNLKIISVARCKYDICLKSKGHLGFVDVNQDGLKDIFYIPTTDQFTDHDDAFSQWLYRQTIGSPYTKGIVFTMSKPGTVGPSDPSLYPTLPTFTPTVFVLERDIGKIRKDWKDLKQTSTPITDANLLLNYHKLTPLTQVGDLKLNQLSQALDLGDGRTAWISGTRIKVVAGFDPASQSLRVLDMPLNLVNLLSSDPLSLPAQSHDLNLIKLGLTDQWQVTSVRDIRSNFNNSQIKLVQDGTTFEIQPGSPRRLMVAVRSAFGGGYKVEYKNQSGVWAVHKMTTFNPGGIGQSETFDYQAPAFDPFRGTWLGFSKVYKTLKPSSEQLKAQMTQFHFYEDAGPEVILHADRARVNGRLIAETLKSLDGTRLSETENAPPQTLNLKDARIYLLPPTTVKRRYTPSGTDFYASERTQITVTDWVKDAEGKPLIPLSYSQNSFGQGYWSPVSDSLVDARKEKIVSSKFYPGEYIINMVREENYDKNRVKPMGDTIDDYDSSGVYLKSSCVGERCSYYGYDDLARIKKMQKSNGWFIEANFAGNSPLTSDITDMDGHTQMTWDHLSGKPLSTLDDKGAMMTYRYTADGLTKLVQRGTAAKRATLVSFKDLTPESIKARAVQVQLLDRSELWRFDGFGDVVEKLVHRDGSWQTLGKSESFNGSPVNTWSITQWGAGPELSFKEARDAQGRTTQTWQRGTGTTDLIYRNNCIAHRLNAAYETGECRTSFGNIYSQSIGNDKININTYAGGEVIGVPTYGVEYMKNTHGEVTGTASIGVASPSWQRLNRVIDPQGLITKTDEQFFIKHDAAGRVLETKSTINDATHLRTENTIKKGLLRESILGNADLKVMHSNFDYNSFGQIIASRDRFRDFEIQKTIGYDDFGRLKFETANLKGKIFETQYTFKLNEVSSAMPWVSAIERDPLGNVTRISYANGGTLERDFAPFSHRLTRIRYLGTKQNVKSVLYQETFGYNNALKIDRRVIENTLAKTPIEERFDYDPKNYQLITANAEKAKDALRSNGAVYKIGATSPLRMAGTYFSGTSNTINYTDHNGFARVFCHKSAPLDAANPRCLIRLNPDEYVLSSGYYVRRIQIDGLTIGVWVDGTFYPVVTDHLGSVKAIATNDGKKLVLTRYYGPWGEKSVTAGSDSQLARFIDQFTIWSFAGLVSNPIYESTRTPGTDIEIYWSTTRAFSPQLREWLTADPLVQWSPDSLVNKPGNWHSVRYAGNDPMNQVDTSGLEAYTVGVGFTAILGGGFEGAGGFYAGVDKHGEFDIGVFASGGIGIGVNIGLSANLGGYKDANSIAGPTNNYNGGWGLISIGMSQSDNNTLGIESYSAPYLDEHKRQIENSQPNATSLSSGAGLGLRYGLSASKGDARTFGWSDVKNLFSGGSIEKQKNEQK